MQKPMCATITVSKPSLIPSAMNSSRVATAVTISGRISGRLIPPSTIFCP